MRSFALLFTLLLLPAAASAASFDAPRRKSGLWEIKFSSAQAKGGQTVQQCIDQQSDDLMKNKMGPDKMSCTRNDMRKDGDRIVADSVCKIDGSTATTHAVFLGRFDSAYRADIKSAYEPPLHGMREASSVIEAKWLGACLAGQKPGDIVMPGGMNMDELMKKGMKNQ